MRFIRVTLENAYTVCVEMFANFANDVTFANIYFANISHLRTSYTRVLLYFGVVSYNVSCSRRRHVEDD